MSNRVGKARRLESIESNIDTLENNLLGVDSFFFKEGSIMMEIKTEEFKYKDKINKSIGFTKEVMIGYINNQIEEYKKESKQLLKELMEDE